MSKNYYNELGRFVTAVDTGARKVGTERCT